MNTETDRAEPQQPSLPSIDVLQAKLGEENPTFRAWVVAQSNEHWAKRDLSSLRIGFELGLIAASPAPDPAQEAAPVAGFAAGIKAAGDWVRDRRFAWESENGYIEPDTGAMSFGSGAHANAKEEYDCELCEIEEGIRAIASPPAAPVANGTEGKRRVVCAACKLEDGTFVTGARHMDGIMHAMKGRIGKKWMHDPAAQGFIDQRGVYMTRQEAWKVAEAAGQILYRCGGDTIDGGHLFSENLY